MPVSDSIQGITILIRRYIGRTKLNPFRKANISTAAYNVTFIVELTTDNFLNEVHAQMLTSILCGQDICCFCVYHRRSILQIQELTIGKQSKTMSGSHQNQIIISFINQLPWQNLQTVFSGLYRKSFIISAIPDKISFFGKIPEISLQFDDILIIIDSIDAFHMFVFIVIPQDKTWCAF